MSSNVKSYIEDEEAYKDKEGKLGYQKCFIPDNDPELRKLGIEVCAITIKDYDMIRNRIVFKRGGKTADIQCVHTAVCQITPSPESESGFAVVSTENRQDLIGLLSMEDQYFALKSFTQALVDNGIKMTLINALERAQETGKEPLDFNEQMRSQLTNALINIAPEETKELALSALDYISADNPVRLTAFSRDFSKIICGNNFKGEDVERLDNINGGIMNLPLELRECIARVQDLPEHLQEKLARDQDSRIKIGIMQGGPLSENVIRELANDDDIKVKIALVDIYSHKLPIDIERKLATEGYTIKDKLASRESLTQDAIRLLSKDIDWRIRYRIAERNNLPDDVVHNLIFDESNTIRSKLAEQYSLTDEEIRHLSGDEPVTKNYLMMHNTLPPDIIERYVNDDDYNVRRIVAQTQILNVDQMRRLSKDTIRGVRFAVSQISGLPEDVIRSLANDINYDVRFQISLKEHLPQDVVVKLATDQEDEIRANIAKYQRLPEELIRFLASDRSRYVRSTILSRSNLSNDTLYLLTLGDDYELMREIAKREDLPDVVIRRIKDAGYLGLFEELPEEYIREFAKSEDSHTLQELAKIDNLPEDIIRKLAENPEGLVRIQIASHPKLPDDLKEKLGFDHRKAIRYEIAYRDDISPELLTKIIESEEKDGIALLKEDPAQYHYVEERIMPYDLYRVLAKKNKLPEDLIRHLLMTNDSIREFLAERYDLPNDVIDELWKLGFQMRKRYIRTGENKETGVGIYRLKPPEEMKTVEDEWETPPIEDEDIWGP